MTFKYRYPYLFFSLTLAARLPETLIYLNILERSQTLLLTVSILSRLS